ncbi:hypothetical protein E2C01_040766 [Portunus trituberculatus]|uniref:Uncharacterized protein n=1 Tax=Portunus trituberculatus TaxID=210409 RepID=A0A5B7FKM7_PORTR|nr:hypothetical protein [Portunus trituberculatus]
MNKRKILTDASPRLKEEGQEKPNASRRRPDGGALECVSGRVEREGGEETREALEEEEEEEKEKEEEEEEKEEWLWWCIGNNKVKWEK